MHGAMESPRLRARHRAQGAGLGTRTPAGACTQLAPQHPVLAWAGHPPWRGGKGSGLLARRQEVWRLRGNTWLRLEPWAAGQGAALGKTRGWGPDGALGPGVGRGWGEGRGGDGGGRRGTEGEVGLSPVCLPPRTERVLGRGPVVLGSLSRLDSIRVFQPPCPQLPAAAPAHPSLLLPHQLCSSFWQGVSCKGGSGWSRPRPPPLATCPRSRTLEVTMVVGGGWESGAFPTPLRCTRWGQTGTERPRWCPVVPGGAGSQRAGTAPRVKNLWSLWVSGLVSAPHPHCLAPSVCLCVCVSSLLPEQLPASQSRAQRPGQAPPPWPPCSWGPAPWGAA